MSKNGSRHALQLGDKFRHLRELDAHQRKVLEKMRLEKSYKKVKRVLGTFQRSFQRLHANVIDQKIVKPDSITTLKKSDGAIYRIKFTDLKAQQTKSMKVNELNLIFIKSPLADHLLDKIVGASIHLIATNVKYELAKIE